MRQATPVTCPRGIRRSVWLRDRVNLIGGSSSDGSHSSSLVSSFTDIPIRGRAWNGPRGRVPSPLQRPAGPVMALDPRREAICPPPPLQQQRQHLLRQLYPLADGERFGDLPVEFRWGRLADDRHV
jgi:hypothetical protein